MHVEKKLFPLEFCMVQQTNDAETKINDAIHVKLNKTPAIANLDFMMTYFKWAEDPEMIQNR